MIEKLEFKNFGPLSDIQWNNLGKINLVIGGNGSGKTSLLKAIYCSLRTLEEYKRGQEPRSASEILVDKLYWTFQAGKIGDLVSKGVNASLSSMITMDGKYFSYSFGKDTTRQISFLENHVPPRETNSVFLPAKEVLSLHQIILDSRQQDSVFGFDDTYFDLAKALSTRTIKGRNYAEFSTSRENLKKIIGGVIKYDENSKGWFFTKNKHKFPMGITAEGIKKVGILDTLLGNSYLNLKSVILIDEPESALHPTAISQLLDIVALLAERGIQFFMASHSYFVVKKLYLIAQERGWSIPVLSHDDGEWKMDDLKDGISKDGARKMDDLKDGMPKDGEWKMDDLKDGMPKNSILDESVRLYRQEMSL